MYIKGHEIAAIAQRLSVYAGTVTTAAERGRWPGGVETVARRILAIHARQPKLSDNEIARLVGCDPSYASTVRLHAEATKARRQK